jgi:hypothetical protein
VAVSLLKRPHGGFRSLNGRYIAVSELKRLKFYNGHMQRPFSYDQKCPFGCNGYVTAMAVGLVKGNGFILVSEYLPGIT